MVPLADSFTFHGVKYRAEIVVSAKQPIRVYRGNTLVAKAGHPGLNPWKIRVGDVDGDGVPELAVGVFKPTRFIPKPHRTIFVFTFTGKKIVKKWMGSSMGRPLLDFCFKSPQKSEWQRLLTLQRTLQNEVSLNQWKWKGFGFRLETPDQICRNAYSIETVHRTLFVWDASHRLIAKVNHP